MPFDWAKPNLKTAYLVEGVFVAGSIGRRVVRWCGPKVRTGSGVLAHPTLDMNGDPVYASPATYDIDDGRPRDPGTPLPAGASWEARLSRCTYDQSLGGWKRNVQSINDVGFTVDIGSDDNLDQRSYSITDLRDMVHVGRWKGQRARLIVVDLENIDNFLILVDGTWDRDPDEVMVDSFKMTIVAGNIIPPTKPWFMWHCPTHVPTGWDDTYPTSWRPTALGSQWPNTFALSDACKGKWMGVPFGGRPANLSGDSVSQNWCEIVPYGYAGNFSFAIVSPDYFCMVYDVIYTDDDGNVVRSSGVTDARIEVFTNTSPSRGPTGTIVKWEDDQPHRWLDDGLRVFARVGGSGSAGIPQGQYSAVSGESYTWHSGENNYPWIGANHTTASATGSGTARNYITPGGQEMEVSYIIRTIFEDEKFGLAGAGLVGLHSEAILHLYSFVILINQRTTFTGRVPLALADEPVTMLNVLSDLMQAIPADLVLRHDPAVGYPRYYPAGRPSANFTRKWRIQIGDLYRTVKLDVKLLDDPDGFYANEIDWSEPRNDYGRTYSGDDAGAMPASYSDTYSFRNEFEQGEWRTNQAIFGKKTMKYWAHDHPGGTASGASLFLQYSARPQKVIEAVHGPHAMKMQLAETIWYDVEDVLVWPGQVRGLRLDLDRQLVTVKSYHWPMEARVVDEVVVDESIDAETKETIYTPRMGDLVDRAEQEATRFKVKDVKQEIDTSSEAGYRLKKKQRGEED